MKNKANYKRTGKVILTNWPHLLGFLITAYVSQPIFKILGLATDESWREIFIDSLFTIPLAFLIYGAIPIVAVYIAISILDFIAFSFDTSNIVMKLLAEWIIIISPFIYWAIKYEFWIWIPLSVSFLTTQLNRRKAIVRLLSE